MLTIEPILVDTSLWVRYLRRGAAPRVIERVGTWLSGRRVATTKMIKLELLLAARSEDEYERLSATLDALFQLTPGAGTWRQAARNGFDLRRHGVLVPANDLLIATVAQEAGANLAHADQHYELMAPYLGLRTISLLQA